MKARIKFRKYGVLRFIGHLDVMRFFQKLMRRADIPIAFTGGYSPHMIMSFASPLGIGLTSDGEYLDIELTAPVDSLEAVKRMNKECAEGIEVISIRQIPDEKKMTGMTILAAADYLVSVKEGTLPENWKEGFSDFMAQKEIRVIKQTKRSEREVDIRPLIYRWEIRGDSIFLQLAAGSAENLKPDLVMETFLSGSAVPEGSVSFAYHRLEMYADMGEDGKRNLVSLEALGQEMSV
ncbi:MAG TPA: TIGR03936 family radical SAM-associated protein [Candidatus Mediterraneibacter tabaqchaliae]|uniref:TIGR03936 family radical SAM-associated protein n=1 Tax=Candidatus Mediterraneibacter tabaqchaliae TaxID=2838689 RepID=A0A9D2U168_9FIRM|nr:TIGR03936 family radical SAM-associated protein [Candidatus Mediterraneibacter tabaqchaliae]